MPRLDGTGPQGQGPRTGRGLGNCKGIVSGGQRGRGQGNGRSSRPVAILSKDEMKIALEIEKKEIEKEIESLN